MDAESAQGLEGAESGRRRAGRTALAAGFAVALIVSVVAVVAFAHLWRLGELPRGLYVDESGIGLAAATLVESGTDEHGVSWPVYFRSFGDWKNPLIVYTVAGLFRLGGPSVWLLRLAGVLWFALLLGGLVVLARRMVPPAGAAGDEGRAAALWALAAGGLLPWFFPVSRVCYEAMTQPAVVVWALCLVHAAYAEPPAEERERGRLGLAFAAGLLLGLSIYSYSTARLLTPLLVLSVLAAYAGRHTWRRHLALAVGCALALAPYLAFTLQHPRRLTNRFRVVSDLFRRRFTAADKVDIFLDRYRDAWSPDFLLLSGDSNHRYSTGAAGEVYWVVLALALLGVVWAVRRVRAGDRFALVLLVNLLLAPVAGALTRELSAIRTLLVGLYLTLFSAAGLALLARLRRPLLRRLAVAAAVLLLAGESGRYLRHYFGPYTEVAVWAFRSHDYPGLLATAYRQGARRIVASWRANQPQAHVDFYRRILPPPAGVEIALEDVPRAAPGTCVVNFGRRFHVQGEGGLARRDFGDGQPVRMRCYGPAAAAPGAARAARSSG